MHWLLVTLVPQLYKGWTWVQVTWKAAHHLGLAGRLADWTVRIGNSIISSSYWMADSLVGRGFFNFTKWVLVGSREGVNIWVKDVTALGKLISGRSRNLFLLLEEKISSKIVDWGTKFAESKFLNKLRERFPQNKLLQRSKNIGLWLGRKLAPEYLRMSRERTLTVIRELFLKLISRQYLVRFLNIVFRIGFFSQLFRFLVTPFLLARVWFTTFAIMNIFSRLSYILQRKPQISIDALQNGLLMAGQGRERRLNRFASFVSWQIYLAWYAFVISFVVFIGFDVFNIFFNSVESWKAIFSLGYHWSSYKTGVALAAEIVKIKYLAPAVKDLVDLLSEVLFTIDPDGFVAATVKKSLGNFINEGVVMELVNLQLQAANATSGSAFLFDYWESIQEATKNFDSVNIINNYLSHTFSGNNRFWYASGDTVQNFYLNSEQIAKLLEGKTREEIAEILGSGLDAVAGSSKIASVPLPTARISLLASFFSNTFKYLLGFSVFCFGLSGLISLANWNYFANQEFGPLFKFFRDLFGWGREGEAARAAADVVATKHTEAVYQKALKIPEQLAKTRNDLIKDLAQMQQQVVTEGLKILGNENVAFESRINKAFEQQATSTVYLSAVDRTLLDEREAVATTLEAALPHQFPIYWNSDQLSNILFTIRNIVLQAELISDVKPVKLELIWFWEYFISMDGFPEIAERFKASIPEDLLTNKRLINFLKTNIQFKNVYLELENFLEKSFNPKLGDNLGGTLGSDFMEEFFKNCQIDAIKEMRAKLAMITNYQQLAIEEEIPNVAVIIDTYYSQNVLPKVFKEKTAFSAVPENIDIPKEELLNTLELSPETSVPIDEFLIDMKRIRSVLGNKTVESIDNLYENHPERVLIAPDGTRFKEYWKHYFHHMAVYNTRIFPSMNNDLDIFNLWMEYLIKDWKPYFNTHHKFYALHDFIASKVEETLRGEIYGENPMFNRSSKLTYWFEFINLFAYFMELNFMAFQEERFIFFDENRRMCFDLAKMFQIINKYDNVNGILETGFLLLPEDELIEKTPGKISLAAKMVANLHKGLFDFYIPFERGVETPRILCVTPKPFVAYENTFLNVWETWNNTDFLKTTPPPIRQNIYSETGIEEYSGNVYTEDQTFKLSEVYKLQDRFSKIVFDFARVSKFILNDLDPRNFFMPRFFLGETNIQAKALENNLIRNGLELFYLTDSNTGEVKIGFLDKRLLENPKYKTTLTLLESLANQGSIYFEKELAQEDISAEKKPVKVFNTSKNIWEYLTVENLKTTTQYKILKGEEPLILSFEQAAVKVREATEYGDVSLSYQGPKVYKPWSFYKYNQPISYIKSITKWPFLTIVVIDGKETDTYEWEIEWETLPLSVAYQAEGLKPFVDIKFNSKEIVWLKVDKNNLPLVNQNYFKQERFIGNYPSKIQIETYIQSCIKPVTKEEFSKSLYHLQTEIHSIQGKIKSLKEIYGTNKILFQKYEKLQLSYIEHLEELAFFEELALIEENKKLSEGVSPIKSLIDASLIVDAPINVNQDLSVSNEVVMAEESAEVMERAIQKKADVDTRTVYRKTLAKTGLYSLVGATFMAGLTVTLKGGDTLTTLLSPEFMKLIGMRFLTGALFGAAGGAYSAGSSLGTNFSLLSINIGQGTTTNNLLTAGVEAAASAMNQQSSEVLNQTATGLKNPIGSWGGIARLGVATLFVGAEAAIQIATSSSPLDALKEIAQEEDIVQGFEKYLKISNKLRKRTPNSSDFSISEEG